MTRTASASPPGSDQVLYLEPPTRGIDGFTTHVMTYTTAVSLSSLLGRPFYLGWEVPASTPPEYASLPDFRDKYGFLLRSPRSLVSNLVDMPADRVWEYDPARPNKLEIQLLHSHFVTTEEIKGKFEHTPIWDFFSIGRVGVTVEEMQQYDVVEWTHPSLAHLSVFYFLRRADKEKLLKDAAVRFIAPIESLATEILAQLGSFYSVHTRLGDFVMNYEDYGIDRDIYRRSIETIFPDASLPVVIATDALHQRLMFSQIFEGRKIIFIDELIMDEFRGRYFELPFRDFNVLTVLNQLIAAAGLNFIGTYRSTFTGLIHRLRQERYGCKDFDFFPDRGIRDMFGPDMRLVPDQRGFFDWNSYSRFTDEHKTLSWRREWDFDKTSIDF
ncbi:MAG TPA: O-fucosyltransferase family protein [Pyrinomonadaceae bacterium]|jgi:hypothetical protein|nr:O-fucosyltransferase family protein [Pyrinomonadaceae bacterium]